MNIQYYSIQLGNILRGARDTRRKKSSLLATPLVQVKEPIFIDGSHYDPITDWLAVPKSLKLLGWKATEGTSYKDPTFPDHFKKAKSVLGVSRLAYHFFRKALDPVKQANWFVDYVDPYLEDDDLLCGDFEEGGETAPQLWAFWNRVIQRKPRNQIIDYSRKLLMDAIPMTASEKAFFKTIPSWVAGYPNDPNPFTTTPAAYIPDPTRWGPVWAWQYADNGQVAGFTSAVDLNLMEPPLIEYINRNSLPADNTSRPYSGVLHVEGIRHGWKFFLQVIDTNLYNYEVVHPYPRETVSSVAQAKGALIATNGGEWDRVTGMPKDYSVSNGIEYVPRRESVPSWMLTNSLLVIDHRSTSNVRQALSGLRYLVQDGTIKPYLDGSEPQYTEGHSRTIEGITADGRHIHMVSEGAYPNQGLTLKQAAEVMKQYGAVTAFDSGGGGDSTLYMSGEVLNVPEDIDNGVHVERRLPQILVITPKNGEAMPYKYTATAKGDNTSLRPDHNTDNTRYNGWRAGTKFYGDNVFIVPEDSGAQKKGDIWLEVKDVSGQIYAGDATKKTGWVAIIHNAQSYCDITPAVEIPTDPEPTYPATIESVDTWKDEAGNVVAVYKGTLTKQ